MDRSVLVGVDFRTGERVVAALETNGLPLAVALWVHFPEYEDLRFVVASRKLDPLSLGDAYLRVNRALDEGGVTVWEAPAMFVMKTTDPFVRELRKVYRKFPSVSGMRMGGQRWGDRVIDDAYAYRIA
jgi:hypothetical protein